MCAIPVPTLFSRLQIFIFGALPCSVSHFYVSSYFSNCQDVNYDSGRVRIRYSNPSRGSPSRPGP